MQNNKELASGFFPKIIEKNSDERRIISIHLSDDKAAEVLQDWQARKLETAQFWSK